MSSSFNVSLWTECLVWVDGNCIDCSIFNFFGLLFPTVTRRILVSIKVSPPWMKWSRGGALVDIDFTSFSSPSSSSSSSSSSSFSQPSSISSSDSSLWSTLSEFGRTWDIADSETSSFKELQTSSLRDSSSSAADSSWTEDVEDLSWWSLAVRCVLLISRFSPWDRSWRR